MALIFSLVVGSMCFLFACIFFGFIVYYTKYPEKHRPNEQGSIFGWKVSMNIFGFFSFLLLFNVLVSSSYNWQYHTDQICPIQYRMLSNGDIVGYIVYDSYQNSLILRTLNDLHLDIPHDTKNIIVKIPKEGWYGTVYYDDVNCKHGVIYEPEPVLQKRKQNVENLPI